MMQINDVELMGSTTKKLDPAVLITPETTHIHLEIETEAHKMEHIVAKGPPRDGAFLLDEVHDLLKYIQDNEFPNMELVC